MKVKGLKCKVCKKDIVLGQMTAEIELDDGTILVPVHRTKCLGLIVNEKRSMARFDQKYRKGVPPF